MKPLFTIALIVFATSCSTNTTPSFEVVSSQQGDRIKRVKDLHNDNRRIFKFIDKGKIKNLTGKSLNSYSLFIDYQLYSDDGRTVIEEDLSRFFIGNAGGFGSSLQQKIWVKDMEIAFDLNELVTDSKIQIPVSKVEALYHILASDAFGYSVNEYVLTSDITTEWLNAQKKL